VIKLKWSCRAFLAVSELSFIINKFQNMSRLLQQQLLFISFRLADLPVDSPIVKHLKKWDTSRRESEKEILPSTACAFLHIPLILAYLQYMY